MKGSSVSHRIVCLAAEAADWLWRLGAWGSVVGVTSFFTIPRGTENKPRIGGFSTARLEAIAALNPDLVVTFSDVQAGITAELMQRGICVLGTNQRSLGEIEATLSLLAKLVDREAEGQRLLGLFSQKLAPVNNAKDRPRVYFEEWNEPLISGITWVSELIERAGGSDIFQELRGKRAAAERMVSPEEICRRNPRIIFASWCGRPVNLQEISRRPGWDAIAAVQSNNVHEIPADDILQPGFRLIYGYEQMKDRIQALMNL